MSVTAIVNFYAEGKSPLGHVEIENAPLPREGEVVYLEEGAYRVTEIIHDGWNRDTVNVPEIILEVEEASEYE